METPPLPLSQARPEQVSSENAIVEKFLGTTTMPTWEEKHILAAHGARRCPDCDEWTKGMSLWGMCKRCENERIEDVVAG